MIRRKTQLSEDEKDQIQNHIDYIKFLWTFNVDLLNRMKACEFPNVKHGSFCIRAKSN